MRSAVVLAVLSLLAATAHAGGPPGATEPTFADPTPVKKVERYGTQIALADLATFALVAVVSREEDDSSNDDAISGWIGLAGYLGGGPAIHLTHGNAMGARKSLTARALIPLGGGILGGLAFAGDDDENAFVPSWFVGAMLGATAGMITAMVLDWTVFAKKTTNVEGPRRPVGLGAHALRPAVKVNPGGATVSVAGNF